ncbi:MAG: hypothetical protein DME99_12585 [Verrucomicrobia bacterium]|nr:MAG: hypothetical protein DME99_12585 [Verrucomicrobiota bacterium]
MSIGTFLLTFLCFTAAKQDIQSPMNRIRRRTKKTSRSKDDGKFHSQKFRGRYKNLDLMASLMAAREQDRNRENERPK